VLEVKTCSAYKAEQWENERPNEEYILQLQWYLYVTGLDYGWFACLAGGQKYFQIYVERDDELISYIFDLAEDFWNKVLTHTIPQIDGSEASTDVLKALYKISDPTAPSLQLTSDFDLLLSQREDIKNQISELETNLNEIDNKIKAELKECEDAETNQFKITWKATKGRETFDSKSFKKDNPDLAAKYIKIGDPSRTFKVMRKEN
jgi:predicted phage-related endonuclease